MRFLPDAWVRFQYRVAALFLGLGRYGAAADTYGRIVRSRPDDSQARFHRAWSLLQIPQRREGIATFQELLRAAPSAFGFFLLGCGLQRESRHEEAVEAFREAARLEQSEKADLHYNWGISLAALRRLEEAAEAFENAARLGPPEVDAWDSLGVTYADLGRWKDAAACQRRVMRLSPTTSHCVNFASTLYELNELDEAEQVLRDVLARDRRSIDAKGLLVQVLTGQDRFDEAVALAREICAREPDLLPARLALAGALAEAGRLDQALAAANAAIAIAPQDPRPHGSLGAVLMKANDGAGALAAFERMAVCLDASVERLPSSPWVWCRAGRGAALSVLGRHDEAMKAFEELLRSDRDFFERWPELASHYQLSLRETGGSART
jgi:tetratricopeptide (TPR) repeat protein